MGPRGRKSGPGATRTRDLLLRRQALYPAELRTLISGGEIRWLVGFPQPLKRARRRVPAKRVRERATSCSGGKRSIQLSYGPYLWRGNSLRGGLSATALHGPGAGYPRKRVRE